MTDTKTKTKTRLLRPTEVADRLQVHRRTLDEWTRAGKIPAVKLSPRIVRYRAEDVEQLVGAAVEGS